MATACLVLAGGLLAGSPAALAAPTPTGFPEPTAYSDWASCINTSANRTGNLLLVIDQSASLAQTDPAKKRVPAINSLLDHLLFIAEERDFSLNVQVAGFASGFAAGQWLPLGSDSLVELTRQVSAAGDDIKYMETDYYNALYGSLGQFDSAPTKDCRALLWVSDGKFDLVGDDEISRGPSQTPLGRPRQSEKDYAPGVVLGADSQANELEAATAASMCGQGGLIGDLRRAKIRVFGLGFNNDPGYSFDLMKALTEGGDYAGTVCGPAVSGMVPPGTFFNESADSLALALTVITATGEPIQVPVCPRFDSERCGVNFRLNSWINKVSLSAIANSNLQGNFQVFLTTPSGDRQELGPGDGQADVGGVALSWQWWGPAKVTAELSGQGNAWEGGDWNIQLVGAVVDQADECLADDPRCGYLSLELVPAVKPVLVQLTDTESGRVIVQDNQLKDGQSIRIGRALKADYAILYSDGTKAGEPPDGVEPNFSVAYEWPGREIDAYDITKSLELNDDGVYVHHPDSVSSADQGDVVIRLSIRLEITVSSAQGGQTNTVFQPVENGIAIPLKPAAGYPQIDSTEVLDLGEFNDDTGFSVTRTIHASLSGNGQPGCVWLPPDQASPAEGLGEITLASPNNSRENCLAVPAGGGADLEVAFTAAKAGTALTFSGAFEVLSAPGTSSEAAQTVQINFRGSARHMNEPQRTGVTLACIVLGLALPLGIWQIIRRRSSVIPADNAITAWRLPVKVENGQVLRDGQPVATKPDDADRGYRRYIPITRRCRSLEVFEVKLSAVTGWPWGISRVKALADNFYLAAGTGEAQARGVPVDADHHCELPLAIHDSWLLAVDPRQPADEAVLFLLVNAAHENRVDDLLRRVREEAPAIIDRLRKAAADGGAVSQPVNQSSDWTNPAGDSSTLPPFARATPPAALSADGARLPPPSPPPAPPRSGRPPSTTPNFN
ncbi:MAG: hypothetical protein LBI84_02295 [Propionibacteriaceae bacterium]|jgi:hypothetical protein|nr:hypothetical protein [Propionibacteriaceae bacterium]